MQPYACIVRYYGTSSDSSGDSGKNNSGGDSNIGTGTDCASDGGDSDRGTGSDWWQQ